MDRKQLRSELAFLLNFDETQADQDFVKARLNKALDRAGNTILERAKLHGGKDYFLGVSSTFSWTASSQTLSIPTALRAVTIRDIFDITSGEPGVRLVVGDNGDQSDCDLFFYDKDTWQWTIVGGPSATRSLRATYEQVWTDLAEDESPTLIPAQYHWLIVWQAGIQLRLVADEKAPSAWQDQLDEMQLDFFKHVSRGRPTSNFPHIQAQVPDASGYYY